MITLTGDDRPIGSIAARIAGHKVDIGYVLGRNHWNKGYMTEAVRALASWLLAQPDIFRVWAVCDLENPASARTLEKAGFVKEGVLRRWVRHPGRSEEPLDCLVFARIK